MFALLFPWACGTHSDVLASRLFQLLDENGDSLINFREFVSGLSKDGLLLHESELGGDRDEGARTPGSLDAVLRVATLHDPCRLGLEGREARTWLAN